MFEWRMTQAGYALGKNRPGWFGYITPLQGGYVPSDGAVATKATHIADRPAVFKDDCSKPEGR